jgi:hypothetical protein
MKPNTLTRWEYRGKIYVNNIRKVLQDPKPTEKQDPDPDPKKYLSEYTTLLTYLCVELSSVKPSHFKKLQCMRDQSGRNKKKLVC